jgi:uncharacterized protein YndB with AHSA1/START domain
VFDAWLDAGHAGAWLFATPAGRMVEVAIDPRVGGAFRMVDRRDGEDVAHLGTYLELERPGRLVFEFGVPRYSDARDRVEVAIVARAGGCEVTLTHALTPGMEAWADSVRLGWTGILDGLAAELARGRVAGVHAWVEGFPGAVTVCDRAGVILGMNAKAAATFEADGGRGLVGSNLLDCHPEPSRTLVADLLSAPRVNAYTIEKRGVRKLIYQAPWFDGGVCGGLVELSLEIPETMPHFVRQG